jgi:hypothetical protein
VIGALLLGHVADASRAVTGMQVVGELLAMPTRLRSLCGMRWLIGLFVAALVLAVGAAWYARDFRRSGLSEVRTPAPVAPADPSPDPEGYATLVAEATHWRTNLAARHAAANSVEERSAVETDARRFLEFVMPDMMRCWLGTPWDFHGTASQPGEEKIACGYFVSTVLRDVGFRVDRFRLAQQPSENILRSFLPKDECVLCVGLPYEAFANDLQAAKPGIYIVGLDTHVGFVVVANGGFRFIHSSGSRPWCVVDQSRDAAEVLRDSRWRMLGNLTANPDVIRSWLSEETIRVHGT